VLLRYNGHERELYGSEPHTTNNRMELTAVIQGLNTLKQPCDVKIVTDSEYVQKGITEWMPRWKVKGWQTADRQPVKNQDLWKALDGALSSHRVSWQWVKGHASHADNIRVDKLASSAARGQTASGSDSD
jgi:ribonuclease HI